MDDKIKEILDRIETASEIFDCLLKPEECTELLDYITNLQQERDKFQLRCYRALTYIRENYCLLDKYGVDIVDDILSGDDDNEY